MKNTVRRGTWFLMLFLGWVILLLNGRCDKRIHLNFIKELKELCKRNSVYVAEDGDYVMIHKRELKCKKG